MRKNGLIWTENTGKTLLIIQEIHKFNVCASEKQTQSILGVDELAGSIEKDV